MRMKPCIPACFRLLWCWPPEGPLCGRFRLLRISGRVLLPTFAGLALEAAFLLSCTGDFN